MVERDINTTQQLNSHTHDKQARLQRMPDGYLGGVCAGLAQYYSSDADMIRLITVLLTVLTAGILGLLYIVLWCVLPIAEEPSKQVQAQATSLSSDTYGNLVSEVSADSKNNAMPLTVMAALAVGIIILAAVMALFFSHIIQGIDPIQFWPLILIAAGVARIVIPDSSGRHGLSAFVGVLIFFVGVVILLATLGLARIQLGLWLSQGAPLLIATLGFLLIAQASKSHVFMLCGAATLTLFILIGVLFYLEPGTLHQIVALLPDGRIISIKTVL